MAIPPTFDDVNYRNQVLAEGSSIADGNNAVETDTESVSVDASQLTRAALTFSTNSGNPFIFSDNPEEISGFNNNSLLYMWGASLGNTSKDVEMYHHVYQGSASGTMRYGVAIWNAGTSATTITYKQKAYATSGYMGGNQFQQPIMQELTSFFASATSTRTVAANSISFFIFDTTMTMNRSIWFRGKFSSSNASNVWMRVFIAGSSRISDGTGLFNIASPETGTSGFTGELAYSENVPTTELATTGTYRLFDNPNNTSNVNEYRIVNSYKSPGASLLAGNYGVIYRLTITGGAGKTARIQPDYVSTRTHASIVFRVNSGTWQYSYKQYSATDPFGIYIPSNPTTLEVALPSGNHGYMTLSFA